MGIELADTCAHGRSTLLFRPRARPCD